MSKKRVLLSGFTLVEVLVVVAIIALFSAVTLVSLSNSRNERNLQSSSQQIASALREAQNYALAGRTAALSEKNCWQAIQFNSATTYGVVNKQKDAAGNCIPGASVVVGSYTLANGVRFSGGMPFPFIIGFRLPRAEVAVGVGDPLANLLAPYLITLTKSGTNYHICVYPSGRVEERQTNGICP